MSRQAFNVLLHGGLYSPFFASLYFGSGMFGMFTSLAALTFGTQMGHYMFRGPIAKIVGVENIPLADRRITLDVDVPNINLTSLMLMDKIDDLDSFAVRVRNHFMQWERCRSRII